MSTTLRKLAYQACRDLGCLRPGQTITGADVETDILEAANQMVDALTIDGLMAYSYPAAIFNLTANLEQYRIGSTQTSPNFAAARPTDITEANCIINSVNPVLRTPMRIIGKEEWARITIRAEDPGDTAPISAIPLVLYFDNGFDPTTGYATINVWPAPIESYELEIFTSLTMPFASFATVTTAVSFPPAYERMIRKCLAVEIAPMMQMNNKLARIPGMLPVSMAMLAKVEQQALEAKSAVQSANAPDALKSCDRMFLDNGRRSNWVYAYGAYRGEL